MDAYFIGIDLGGSKILATIFKDEQALESAINSTDPLAGEEGLARDLVRTVEEALEAAKVQKSSVVAIGIGAPGPLNINLGTLVGSPNLGVSDFPIRACLEKAFAVPVLLENDVNAGTYGEYCYGAAQGRRHVIGVFPGTGIGGGLILDGKLYRGARGNAGEVGHTIIQLGGPMCGCGQLGCLEALASRSAIARDLVAQVAIGKVPTVAAEAGTDVQELKSNLIGRVLSSGEEPALELLSRAAERLGIGIANCVNLLNPEMIVLGGGLVEKLGSWLVERATDSMRRHALPTLVDGVEVVVATLGDEAVVRGAARLANEALV
jgi:glucokinase